MKDHKDLKHHNCLKYMRNSTWHLVKDGRSFDYTPDGNVATNSGENLRQFAIAGQGIVHLPYFLTRHAIEKGRLVPVLMDYEGRKMQGYIVRPRHRHCPARVMSLIDFTADKINLMQAFLTSLGKPL